MEGSQPPPTFVLDARDALVYPTLVYYARMCREFGREDRAQEAARAAEEFRIWQNANSGLTQLPEHELPLNQIYSDMPDIPEGAGL